MMRKLLVLVGGLLIGLLVAIGIIARRLTNPKAVFEHPQEGLPKPGSSSRVIVSGGVRRGFLLFVPSGYTPNVPSPLVLSLHGFGSSASGQKYLSHWEKLAEEENFCVVYPQGSGYPLRWNASNEFAISPIDDVAFIGDVMRTVSDLLSIDSRRIYVTGMSNGGSMTARLAWTLPGVFAAAGIVSAPPVKLPANLDGEKPVPLIAFYGTSDPLVKYKGGTVARSPLTRLLRLPAHQIAFPAIKPWIEAWAQRNGCNPNPESLPLCNEIMGLKFTGRQKASEVEFYTIAGSGHTWPGGAPTFVGITNRSIDATTEMWEFFKRHSMDD